MAEKLMKYADAVKKFDPVIGLLDPYIDAFGYRN